MPVVAALAVWPSAAAAQVQLVPVGSFSSPRHVSAPAGDYSRLFVVEGAGTVRLVKDGVVQPDPFLDISAQVEQGGEGGLLSMAFAPDYASSRRFYVFYTFNDGAAGPAPIRVEEYLRAAGNPALADATTARPMVTIPHPDASNHYGGQLAFGPDGLLYVGTGDGGGSGDQFGNARDASSQLGKLLRLDPLSGAQPQMYAYGLRNPFRFSFDRGSGDLLIGDVGQGAWEEVDRVAAGAAPPLDFGWALCEGAHAYPPTNPASPCTTGLAPVFEYAHELPSPCTGTVIGGFVVRDPGLESLVGRYVYADYCKDYVRSIALPPVSGDPLPLFTAEAPVSFGEDACARIYLAQQSGAVSRIGDGSPAPCPPAGGAGGGGGGGPGGGAGGGAGGGGSGAEADVTAPALTLAGALRQRLRRRGVLVRVACSEACRVRALGSATFPGAAAVGTASRTVRLREVRRSLSAGVAYSLRLRLSQRGRRAVRSALLRGARVRVSLLVRVRDGAGNLRVGVRRVRLVL